MQENKSGKLWLKCFADLLVPIILCGYASFYYFSVAKLPRPEVNLILIQPVYWILLIASLFFCVLRVASTYRSIHSEVTDAFVGQAIDNDISGDKNKFYQKAFRSLSFISLTIICVVLIPKLGFVSTIYLYVFLLLMVLGVREIKVLLFTPTILCVFLWVCLEKFLNLRLPDGILF